MGVESMLVDRKHRRLFYLGKWYGDIPLKRCGWEGFLTAVMEPFTNEFPEDDETLVWRRKQARRMWAFCVVAEWNVTRTRDGQADYARGDWASAFELCGGPDCPDGIEECIFSGRDPAEKGQQFVTVMSVHDGDDWLHPDPCAEAQAEAERGG